MFGDNSTRDRGQVGIGTLIIFIAMVLVAAVAAGVLVNTAGLLQSKASDTGQDAQSQVSNQVEVVGAVGTTSSTNVSQVDLTVMKSAGSDDIDLEQATLHYVADDSQQTLTNSDFGIETLDGTTASGDAAVLTEQGDRLVVTIDLDGLTNLTELSEGEEATIRIVDQSGATTTYGVNVPDTISSSDSVVEV
jgi:flagellin-like protein